jgi:hypothetical protein
MRFEPEAFRCRSHPTVDLTSLVEEQLDDEYAPPVAFDPAGLFRRKNRPVDFEVIVFCPGGHDEPVTGKAWRD